MGSPLFAVGVYVVAVYVIAVVFAVVLLIGTALTLTAGRRASRTGRRRRAARNVGLDILNGVGL